MQHRVINIQNAVFSKRYSVSGIQWAVYNDLLFTFHFLTT